MPLFPTRTDDEQAKITADYLPSGKPFTAKRILSKTMFKFIKGCSVEFNRLESTINQFASGWNLTKSTDFLEEWEKTQGIPDNSFPANGGAENRRRHAHAKLVAEGIHTKEDIERFLETLGWITIVYPGYYFWLNPDPRVPPFASEKEARFSLVIETFYSLSNPDVVPAVFPVPFPWVFGVNNYAVTQKALREYIPANVQLIWILESTDERYGFGYFPFGISQFGF